MWHNLTMSKNLKNICFKFFGKLVYPGIATCVLLAFLGPYLITHFNIGVDSEGDVAQFQAGGRKAILSIHEGMNNDKQKQIGMSAMHDVEVAANSLKKSRKSAIKDENRKQSHLKDERLKGNNIPAAKKMSYHDKKIRAKIVERHGFPEDKISSGVIANKELRGQNLTQLDDIFIGVKTGGVYHNKRLDLLLETWIIKAKNQVSCIN